MGAKPGGWGGKNSTVAKKSSYIPSAPDITVELLWEVIKALGFDKGEVRRHLEENATPRATR